MDASKRQAFLEHLDEMFRKSADFVYTLSKYTCSRGYTDQSNCSWYHGAWQYLRIQNKVSAPTWHLEFYYDSLSAILKDGDKVLISSTADYTMLALLISVIKSLALNIDITVTDICQTPLIICEWYAEEINYPIQTIQEDICSLNLKFFYNLVITDAFLTRFKQNDKQEVVEKWYNLLEAGGSVITTARVENLVNTDKVTANPEESNLFLSANQKSILNDSQHKKPKIESICRQYAEKIYSYPFKSHQEVINLLKTYNFTVNNFYQALVTGEFKPRKYCRIVAQKNKDLTKRLLT
jgi:hypothetical protein